MSCDIQWIRDLFFGAALSSIPSHIASLLLHLVTSRKATVLHLRTNLGTSQLATHMAVMNKEPWGQWLPRTCLFGILGFLEFLHGFNQHSSFLCLLYATHGTAEVSPLKF